MTRSEEARNGWDEHRRRQIRDVARGTTPTQRLDWLEEALRLARDSGALARERRVRAKANLGEE